jgi:hypothetical protein
MTGDRRSLHSLDLVDPPDLWDDATRRPGAGQTPPPVQPARRRIAAGVVAFIVFGAVVALVVVDRGAEISVEPSPRPGGIQDPNHDASVLLVTLSDATDESSPTAIATFGEQVVEACLLRDQADPLALRTCDSDLPPMLVPAWTHVRFDGDFTFLRAWFQDELGQHHGPAAVPDRGTRARELWIEARLGGGFAIFRLAVEPTRGEGVLQRLSEVLKVSCADGRTRVGTPFVGVGPDGMDVDVVGPAGWRLELRPLDPPIHRWVVPIEGTDARTAVPRVWSGTELVARCVPPGNVAPIVRPRIHPGEDLLRAVDIDGTSRSFLPWCPTDELVRVVLPSRSTEPTSPQAVRRLIDGVLPGDRIEEGAFPGQGIWLIERPDSGIVGFVTFPEGIGYACRGSGLFGS